MRSLVINFGFSLVFSAFEFSTSVVQEFCRGFAPVFLRNTAFFPRVATFVGRLVTEFAVFQVARNFRCRTGSRPAGN
jgi:hypothetical protein